MSLHKKMEPAEMTHSQTTPRGFLGGNPYLNAEGLAIASWMWFAGLARTNK